METTRPIPAIYYDAIQEIASMNNKDDLASKMPTFDQCKTSLYDSRRKRLPTIPESRRDVHFNDEWVKTPSGESFLIAEDGDGDDKLIIFGTDKNIELLCESDTIYVDGTFQTCPILFYQIFTMHAFKHGKQYPLIYAFLPNKQRYTYERAMNLVRQKADVLQLTLNPQTVSDFEQPIKQAIQLTFPDAQFQGCYYHFCQAIMQKTHTLGLQVQYQDDTLGLKSFIRKTAALAFVPIPFIHFAWQGIKANRPDLTNIDNFVSYFEDVWLVGHFPKAEWNVYNTDGPWTNNHLEGWHNRLKRVVGKTHPNIFKCVEIFQREQTSTEISLQQLSTGSKPPRRTLKSITRDKKITELKNRFSNNAISLSEYVAGMAAHTNI